MAHRDTIDARIFAVGLELVARAWRSRNDGALSELRLSTTLAYPIMAVHRLGGGVRQNVVADALGIEGPSLVRSLDTLGTMGLLERRDDPFDRRAKTLYLTREGERLALQIDTIVGRVRRDMLADVTESDLTAAARVLRAIARASGVNLTASVAMVEHDTEAAA
jgi:MarR family transcriptional regulator, transcriptional regulator for hemolysin